MSIEIHIPRFLHKERHQHRCPIHRRGKCQNKCNGCEQCIFLEDNEVCQKTLRSTGLEFHDFPCLGCMSQWRNQYGGETLIDALINLEEAARHAHVAPDAHVDAREEHEAETDPDVKELMEARKRV